MEYVYCIIFNWSVEDEEQIETYIFKNYEDAVEKFQSIIKNEKNPNMSWVGEQAYDSNGKLNNGYFHHEFIDSSNGANLTWQVGQYNVPWLYSFLTLTKQKLL